MKLSVVIPCYNEAATIAQLLRAVRASPYSDLEIIVVDVNATNSGRAAAASIQCGRAPNEKADARSAFGALRAAITRP